MKRRTKAILAVVLCIIPIIAVFVAWSLPVIRRHQTFDTSLSFGPLEINVSIPLLFYDEFKVEIEVTDVMGILLAGSVVIRNSEGDTIEQIGIPDIGNYSTDWLPASGEISIDIYAPPVYGSMEGEIWVWARYSYLRFWYGG